MRGKIIVSLCALVLICGGGRITHAQSDVEHITVDGADRTYTLYLPASYNDEQPIPLVIVLHPFASSGKAMQALTGFDVLADQYGFMVVYPDSADYDWNDGSYPSESTPAMQPGDDVAFIDALIDHLADTYAVNRDKVYLVGYAAGGSMAYRLACEIPDRFARVAVTNTLMWGFHTTVCGEPTSPVSMLMLLGAEDDTAPLEGRAPDNSADAGTRRYSLEDTLAFWTKRNGCDLTAVQSSEQPRMIHYGTCQDQTTVTAYVLDQVGNNWPRVGDYVLNQVGIDQTELVTRYFMEEGSETSLLPNDLETTPPYSGYARSYSVYVPPSYTPDTPMPIVMVLHGRPGSSSWSAYVYDMNPVAREEGFVVVYPDGLPLTASGVDVPGHEWNYTRGYPAYQNTTVDDTEFLSLLIDDLAQDLNIDQKRVYITGFSNGGFMTLRVACDAPDRFAAFAPIGATLLPELEESCENTPPVPILYMHGTEDSIVPWNGRTSGEMILMLSAADTAIFWAMHNQCEAEATDYLILPTQETDPATEVYRYNFGGCVKGADVVFYAIDGGGHYLPGTRNRVNYDSPQQVNMDIRTAETLWAFFKQYSLP